MHRRRVSACFSGSLFFMTECMNCMASTKNKTKLSHRTDYSSFTRQDSQLFCQQAASIRVLVVNIDLLANTLSENLSSLSALDTHPREQECQLPFQNQYPTTLLCRWKKMISTKCSTGQLKIVTRRMGIYSLPTRTLILDLLHVPHALVVRHQVHGIAVADAVVACEVAAKGIVSKRRSKSKPNIPSRTFQTEREDRCTHPRKSAAHHTRPARWRCASGRRSRLWGPRWCCGIGSSRRWRRRGRRCWRG